VTEEHGSDRFALKLPKGPEGPKGPKGLEGEGLAPSAPASSIDADLDDLADVQLWDSNSMCQAVLSLQQRNSFNSFNSYKQPLSNRYVNTHSDSCHVNPSQTAPPRQIPLQRLPLSLRFAGTASIACHLCLCEVQTPKYPKC
jgi:hypothetical protein